MKSTRSIPPKLAQRLLQWFLRDDLAEEVLGDLDEKFSKALKEKSLFKAKLNYWYQVFNYLRPFAIRNYRSNSNYFIMYQHHFKIGLRNIFASKAFSIINILGLALGLVSFLFIFLWVHDENQIDNFHENGDQLYNVYATVEEGSGKLTGSYNSPMSYVGTHLLLEGAKNAIPEIIYVNHYATGYELPWGYPKTFRNDDNLQKFEGSRVGSDFFKMFDYQIITGDTKNPLSDISSIVISRKMAQIFFNSPEEAIGRVLRYENKLDFEVKAVFEDVSKYSSLKFDYLISFDNQIQQKVEWSSLKVLTTYKLAEGAAIKDVTKKLNAFLKPRLNKSQNNTLTLGLQSFKDQYLVSQFVKGKPEGGRIEYVHIFLGAAIFILIVACINFMNLSTARSVKRAKEVAVRKVVGSSKGLLIQQFLIEFTIITLLAFALSLVLVKLFLPAFNDFTGKQIELPLTQIWFWSGLIGLIAFTSFFAGVYPSFFLSVLKPLNTLKGTFRFSNKARWFRKGLVVFQFSLSILLLIAAVVFTWQTNYVENSHLGYNKENLIYLRIEGTLNGKYELFRKKLSDMPGVAMVDRSSEAPHAMNFVVSDPINWEEKDTDKVVNFKPTSVGYDFIDLMQLKVVEGRAFNRDITSDSSAFMINETAVKEMGLENPIGKWISAWDKKGYIIGILKDFHTHSFHERIKPMIVDIKEDLYFGDIIVRSQPGKTKEALASMEEVYKEINPDFPFDYKFLDQEYDELYKSEEVASKLSNIFAGLAITISCLGLLGLSMFSAQQRTKEIGIRKVLGASIHQILSVFSKEFMSLVGLGFLISAPISWLVMSNWLDRFAYRVELSWWIFALVGILTLFIALFTVSFQSIKMALLNPADTLRAE